MSELDELKRMIRIGWSLNDSPAFVANGMSHELQDEIQRTIDSIRDDLVPTFDVNQRVTFLTLSSEFEYAFGIQDRQAISQLGDTLATYGVTRQLAEWKTARSTPWLKLERWPEPGQTWIASATNDQERAELMRRQIWALMAVAFYGQFVDGHIDSAIDDLRKIETIIRSELRPLWHGKSYGSQERCNEFLAQAHRTRGESGDYEESEKRFSMAQEFADLRLSQELKEAEEKKKTSDRVAMAQEALQYGAICTARVLGGLGRLSTLQGRLTRARQLFLSAKTLLIPVSHARLRDVIDSHLEIVERRLLLPRSKDWQKALAALEKRYQQFARLPNQNDTGPDEAGNGLADIDGARRCSAELARAYLDEAEDTLDSLDRRSVLATATTWIERLKQTDGDNPGRATFRAHLFAANAALLELPPDIVKAEQELTAAQQMNQRHFRLDYAGIDRVEPMLTEGALLGAKLGPLDQVTSSKLEITKHPIATFEAIRESASLARDTRLEAEALLRLAAIEYRLGLISEATAHLNARDAYVPFIQDGAHDALMMRILREPSFKPSFLYPGWKWDKTMADKAELHLSILAFRQTHNVRRAAATLGINETTLRSRLRDAGILPP